MFPLSKAQWTKNQNADALNCVKTKCMCSQQTCVVNLQRPTTVYLTNYSTLEHAQATQQPLFSGFVVKVTQNKENVGRC